MLLAIHSFIPQTLIEHQLYSRHCARLELNLCDFLSDSFWVQTEHGALNLKLIFLDQKRKPILCLIILSRICHIINIAFLLKKPLFQIQQLQARHVFYKPYT